MTTTVVVQGERGGYSEEAARKVFDDDLEVLTADTYLGVLQTLRADRRGIVPIENTFVGTFAPVAELLMAQQPWIDAEVLIPLHASLIVHPDADPDAIERVVGYPELLDRCRGYIDDRGLQEVAATDTAGAVRLAKDQHGPETAAIAPPLAAELQGMEIAERDVQDPSRVVGRLFCVSRYRQEIPDDADKTSIGFVLAHKPGSLHDALGVLAGRGINLTRLDCRPIPDRPWHYAFHADLEGSAEDPEIAQALQDLGKRSLEVRVFGSYKAAEEP